MVSFVSKPTLTLAQHTWIAGTECPARDLGHTLTNPLSLVGTGTVDKAAIFNSEGTSAWATSQGFAISPVELKAVVTSFADTKDFKDVQVSGFHIAGEKFFTLHADARSLYGKKVYSRFAPLDFASSTIYCGFCADFCC